MFFEREMLNPNNEKYLLKTVGSKLYVYYMIYGSTTTAITNLIPRLANAAPRIKFHFHLPSSLILWSYPKKITYTVSYESRDLRQQRIEDQAFISLHLQADQICKSFTTQARSLNS